MQTEYDTEIKELETKLNELAKEKALLTRDLNDEIRKLNDQRYKLVDKRSKIIEEQKKLIKLQKSAACVGTFTFADGSEFRTYTPITSAQRGRSMVDFMDMVSRKGLPVDHHITWR